MSPTLLIAGCGDVGNRLAESSILADWTRYGLRRDASRLSVAALPVPADLQQSARPAAWPSGAIDYLVYCVAAGQSDEAGYRTAYVDGLQTLARDMGQGRRLYAGMLQDAVAMATRELQKLD